jgi:hypothetical protein
MAQEKFADDLECGESEATEAQFDRLLRVFFARLPRGELQLSRTKAPDARFLSMLPAARSADVVPMASVSHPVSHQRCQQPGALPPLISS